MSHAGEMRDTPRNGFPRVSGDEPAFRSGITSSITFSPREWG